MSRAKGQAARRVASVVASATLAASLVPVAPALAAPANSTVATSSQSIVAQDVAATPASAASEAAADSAAQQLADGTYSATASTGFGMIGLHSAATIVVRDGKPYAIVTTSDEGHKDGETNSPKYDALWIGDDYASLPDASKADVIEGIPVYGDAIAAGDTTTYNDGSGKVITNYQFVIPTTFDALSGDGIGYVARYTSHYKNGGGRADTWGGSDLKHFTFANITRASDATDVPGMASTEAQAVIDKTATLPASDATTAFGKSATVTAPAAHDVLTGAQKDEVTNLTAPTSADDVSTGMPADGVYQVNRITCNSGMVNLDNEDGPATVTIKNHQATLHVKVYNINKYDYIWLGEIANQPDSADTSSMVAGTPVADDNDYASSGTYGSAVWIDENGVFGTAGARYKAIEFDIPVTAGQLAGGSDAADYPGGSSTADAGDVLFSIRRAPWSPSNAGKWMGQSQHAFNINGLVRTGDARTGDARAGDIDQARALIAALPTSMQVTSSPSTYEAQIEAAQEAYEQLSTAEQATLDSEPASGRSESYGRVLEIAAWSLAATKPVDNATTLEDDTYSSVTDPALSSSYSKGKSTSPRNRPWEVTQVTVRDGKAYAEIQVHSNTYTYMVTDGQRINSEQQQYEVPSGGTTRTEQRSVFHNVPIKLNQPLYFTAYSTSMQTEITFNVTASIDESAKPRETNLDRFEKLVAELPKDSYEVTTAHLSQIEEAWTAYQGLTDAERKVADETSFAGLTYGRIMLADCWAAWALAPVDNSTTLADGVYTAKSGLTSTSAMGNSDSVRQRKWSVDRVTVKDGKATALISRDGNDPLASIKWGGQEYKNLRADKGSEFEVPIDLNSTEYLVSRISGATSATYGITYSLTNAIDEATAQPDSDASKPGTDAPSADAPSADDPDANDGGGSNNNGGSNNGNGGGGPDARSGGSGNGSNAIGGSSAVRTPGGLSSGSNLTGSPARRAAAVAPNNTPRAAGTPATGGNALTNAAAGDGGSAAGGDSDADDATPLANSASGESAPYEQGVNDASASERQAAEARAITIAVIALALAAGFCSFLDFFRRREH